MHLAIMTFSLLDSLPPGCPGDVDPQTGDIVGAISSLLLWRTSGVTSEGQRFHWVTLTIWNWFVNRES